MASTSRTVLLARIQKALKKHYKPVAPSATRSVLEQTVFGILLENSSYEAAELALVTIKGSFFDWNEIRVATPRELAELAQGLHDPQSAAQGVRNFLQAVFDSQYSFDLESFRKLTLGQAQERIQKLKGATPFAVAYVTQASLGGHAIPLDRGAVHALSIVGILSDDYAKSGNSGLERAIPKNRGIEFGSLLHHFAAELMANPYSTNVHKLLLEVAPDCKAKLPRRPAKKEEPAPAPEPAPATKGTAATTPKRKAGDEKESEARAAKSTKPAPRQEPIPAPKVAKGKPSKSKDSTTSAKGAEPSKAVPKASRPGNSGVARKKPR